MIRRHRRSVSLALALSVALVTADEVSAVHRTFEPTAGSSVAVGVQIDRAEFVKRFRDAMRVGDLQTMSRLFKSEQNHAIGWIIDTCQRMATNPSEGLAKDLQAQKDTWEETYETRFVSKMERFYAFLRPDAIGTLNGLAVDGAEASNRGRGLLADPQAKDRMKQIEDVVAEARRILEYTEQLGDKYLSSEMWLLVADLSAPTRIPEKDANLGRALEGYTKFLSYREEIELSDDVNRRAKNAIEELERLGGEIGGGKGPTAEVSVGTGSSVPGAPVFESTATTKFARPSYLADDLYLTWNTLWIAGAKGTATFGRMENGPTVERTGAAKIEVTGSDGVTKEYSLNNRIQLAETTVGRGDEQRPWAFLLVDPGAQEFFHTVPMNMAAGNEGLALNVSPAASMLYDVNGTEVRVIDDNLDGVYGGPDMTYVWPGMRKGEFESQFDTMLVGKSKRAVPFSRLAQVDGEWFQLEPEFKGRTLRYAPVEMRTGTLKLSAKGADIAWYVVEGEDDLEGVRFDLAGARKGVEVPVGRYHLLSVGVRKGKRSSMLKAFATPPAENPSISVSPDDETEMTAGSPYTFDFDFFVEGNEVEVKGESVVVVGAGGERYHRIWSARAEPEIEVRKAGSSRGSSVGKLQAVWNQQEVVDVGTARAWKALDATAPSRHGSEVEMRLSEKNDLFGKIESDWLPPKD